jgi:pyruvate dehydrogenase E1 component alpha subunit
MVAVPAQDDLGRVIADDGKPLPGARVPALPDHALARIFDRMLLVRVVDHRMAALQREGRLELYMKATGEEATHFAVAALRDTDWIFPSYREHGTWFWRGYTVAQYVDQLFGTADDPAKGRQMPGAHSAGWLRIVSISSPVGTQIPQAVGVGYAAKTLGKDDVSMVFFGEGATSTGEFHVGMNFAGVWKTPTVFLCRNKAAPARRYAAKAAGYGMPGVRVDGGDVLAVYQAAADAVARARTGGGPTLIEAVVTGKDPVERLRGYLTHRDIWAESWEREISERHHQEVSDAIAAAADKRGPDAATLFDDVYEQLPWHLREQLAEK